MAEDDRWKCPHCGGKTKIYCSKLSSDGAFRTRYRRCKECERPHPRQEVVQVAPAGA